MSELENVVKAVEGEVKTVTEAVVAEVKSVEKEVVAEVEKVEEKVKAALVKIEAEEKLLLRETELEYLKIQLEMHRLQVSAEAKAKTFTDAVEKLYVKYGLSKAEYVFDAAVAQFKKL